MNNIKTPQNYEEYWKFTAAYTDYNGEKFLKTLEVVVNFIDRNKPSGYRPELYDSLIQLILEKIPKEGSDPDASSRKAVNQLVKLGFINPFLNSYPEDTQTYLDAKSNRRRESILSRIVYSNSSLNSSVSYASNLHQINFLIKTLEEIGKLHEKDIVALMTVDIENVPAGLLRVEELKTYRENAEKSGFIERKYNQISYLINLLSKLDDLVFVDHELYFKEDAETIFGSDLYLKYKYTGRDMYLHRIYKNQLAEESQENVGAAQCMVENLPYPSLVASHIKPFIQSDENEKYDPSNGLLLSRNMDILFDQGFISFESKGSIIISNQLPQSLQEYLSRYKLNAHFINSKRNEYFKYHRELYKEKLGNA